MPTNRTMSLALAAGALALLTACGASTDGMTSHDGMNSSTPTSAATQQAGTANDADATFAQMMIPHHEQAVEMAELAATRAEDPEVKELAEKIKGAQDPEIQTMKSWLEKWGKSTSGGMNHEMPGIMSADAMKKLEQAKGKAFDKQFATLMIAHHEGAIEMAKTEQAQGADPAAKELATAIVSAQQAEIEQMRAILARL